MAAVLFLCIAGFYWKLTLSTQFDWMSGPDFAEQVLPWFQLQAHEWHLGRFPLWDPYVWAGQPLFGQAQPGAAYPLNWLLFLLPLQNGHIAGWALAWYYVVIHLMAAWFSYLLCRDLGRSRTASLAGGLIFSLSGYLGNISWPQMINGAVWAPLIFLFQFRATRSRPWVNAALSGMFLGVAFLSGHHQVPVFIALAWVGVWIYLIAGNRRLAIPAALAVVFTGLAGAMQTLPAYEYGHLAKRWVSAPDPVVWGQPVPYFVHAEYDLKAFSFFGIVFPGVKMHYDPFLGVVAFSLALLAIAALWRDGRVRLLAVIALGAIVYSLGHNSVFQGFLYGLLPEIDKARSPSAAVLVFQCAAAALAAFGVDELATSWRPRFTWILAGFGAFTLALVQFVLFANKLAFPFDDRVILTGVIALAAAALFAAYGRGALTTPQANVLLVLLLLFELGNGVQNALMDRSDRNQMQWLDKIYANTDIADYLRKQPGFQRAEVAQDAFAPNWGAWNGVEMHGGKGASALVDLLDSEFFGITGRRMFGVAYTIAKAPERDSGELVFTGASGMKVFRRDAFPRAWAVHELLQVANIGEGNIAIGRDPESFHHKAYIAGKPPRVEACAAPETVQLIEHDADRLTIRADLACDGMVVLSDAFYPGWRARVDHRPAGIFQVNGAMRGVLVPRGSHTVTMRYRPWTVYLGAALTLLGILIPLCLVRMSRGV
jgi:Bacterial membrane protein YfhO